MMWNMYSIKWWTIYKHYFGRKYFLQKWKINGTKSKNNNQNMYDNYLICKSQVQWVKNRYYVVFLDIKRDTTITTTKHYKREKCMINILNVQLQTKSEYFKTSQTKNTIVSNKGLILTSLKSWPLNKCMVSTIT